jgi:hypothetical protein
MKNHTLSNTEIELIKSKKFTSNELLSQINISRSWLYRFAKLNHIQFPSKTKECIGKRYGKIIIKDAFTKGKCKAYFVCKCDCGNVFEKEAQRITGKWGTRSCGCLQIENSGCKVMPNGESMFRELMKCYRISAKHRQIPFSLTEEIFRKLTKQNCHYCGSIPQKEKTHPKTPSVYIYNGIDRVDNTMGYELENVVSCCEKCNRAKHTMSLTNFKNWIDSVYEHFVRKNRP